MNPLQGALLLVPIVTLFILYDWATKKSPKERKVTSLERDLEEYRETQREQAATALSQLGTRSSQ